MSNNMSSQRQLRFSELIRSLISDCLLVEDFYNFSFKTTSITISYVKMSKDLRIANVYLMPLGGENKNKIIEEIASNLYGKDYKYYVRISQDPYFLAGLDNLDQARALVK